MDSAEALTNATIGLAVSFLAVRYLFPLWGWEATHAQAVGVTGLFWALSAGRTYLFRKVFRWLAQ